MNQDTNSINWFEIPVSDMARAKHFYQVIFSMHMNDGEMLNMQYAFFPYHPGNSKISGALVKSEMHKPGMEGAIVYLNANPNMDEVLEKVEQEGGKILLPKTKVSGEIGYMAFFSDTEGNKVALHSQN